MAKKKKRIPKTIGGVKLPKELRRAGEKIIDQAITTANSPQGKAMIATGLSMAAAAWTPRPSPLPVGPAWRRRG